MAFLIRPFSHTVTWGMYVTGVHIELRRYKLIMQQRGFR